MARQVALSLFFLSACRAEPVVIAPEPPSLAATPESESKPKPPPAQAAETPASVRPASPTELLVAGPGGVAVLDLDGTKLEQRSTTPAVAVRWLPGRERAVVLGEDSVVRLLDRSGGETPLARLPTDPPCASGADNAGLQEDLGLRSDEEMWISADGAAVCIWLSDHPHDMRSNLREVALRLSDGTLTQQLTLGGTSCGAPEGPGRIAPCDAPPLANTEEAVPSPIGGLTVSESPDGAWSQVLVGSMLGDLLHLQYVLVRNTDLAIFPLPHAAGAWPKPVILSTQPDLEALVPELPDFIAGETEAWVGPHHLVLDQTLYIAGERIVDLGGDLAPP